MKNLHNKVRYKYGDKVGEILKTQIPNVTNIIKFKSWKIMKFHNPKLTKFWSPKFINSRVRILEGEILII